MERKSMAPLFCFHIPICFILISLSFPSLWKMVYSCLCSYILGFGANFNWFTLFRTGEVSKSGVGFYSEKNYKSISCYQRSSGGDQDFFSGQIRRCNFFGFGCNIWSCSISLIVILCGGGSWRWQWAWDEEEGREKK